MIGVPPDRQTLRAWFVFDPHGRWLTAARRFAAELMPPPLVASIQPIDSPWPPPPASPDRRAVVLWQVDRSRFGQACDWVAAEAIRRPRTLRLVASDRLSDSEMIVLSELGVAQTLRHPEHLPRLAPMIGRYFL